MPLRAGSPFSGSPVSRSRLGAAADQVRVLYAEPGRDAALDVSDDERVPVPCADSVTSTENSNSLFAGRWLRALDLNLRPISGVGTVAIGVQVSLGDTYKLAKFQSTKGIVSLGAATVPGSRLDVRDPGRRPSCLRPIRMDRA